MCRPTPSNLQEIVIMITNVKKVWFASKEANSIAFQDAWAGVLRIASQTFAFQRNIHIFPLGIRPRSLHGNPHASPHGNQGLFMEMIIKFQQHVILLVIPRKIPQSGQPQSPQRRQQRRNPQDCLLKRHIPWNLQRNRLYHHYQSQSQPRQRRCPVYIPQQPSLQGNRQRHRRLRNRQPCPLHRPIMQNQINRREASTQNQPQNPVGCPQHPIQLVSQLQSPVGCPRRPSQQGGPPKRLLPKNPLQSPSLTKSLPTTRMISKIKMTTRTKTKQMTRSMAMKKTCSIKRLMWRVTSQGTFVTNVCSVLL